jgi:flagellar basal-body rod protein FlgF
VCEITETDVSDKEIIGLSRLIVLRQQLDNVARNVANQTTPGFKASHLGFQEYLTQAKEEVPSPRRSLVAATQFIDFSKGELKPTGNPLDVAIVDQSSFFVVQTANGPRYTRVGSFTLDAKGDLTTLEGKAVLGVGGRVSVPNGSSQLMIGPNGSVSTKQGSLGQLRIVRFEDTRKLRAEDGGLFSTESSPIDVPPSAVRLATGVLEMSNVNAVGEMTKLMAANRAYDLVAQVILKENDKNELKRLAGEDM